MEIPLFMHRIIEEAVSLARKSPHINQASGVSVRTSIACLENMVSSAERRGLVTGEKRVMPRVCDLSHVVAATRGKIELMMADDEDATEDKLVMALLGEAVKSIFDRVADIDDYEDIADAFEAGLKLQVGDEVSAAEQVASMKHVEGLTEAAVKIAKAFDLDPRDEQVLASTGEFVLEALYVHNRLSKHAAPGGSRYGR